MTRPSDTQRQKIIVALDGSPAAATALPVAQVMAGQLDATVEVLYVADPDAGGVERPSAVDAAALAGATLRKEQGDAAAAILAASAEPETALVVLTTHGRTVEPGRALGHVAERIVEGAGPPLLLVRPEAAAQANEAPAELRRLLVPLDGTPSTASALQPVTQLATRLGASVDLLYVADPGQTAPTERGSISLPRYIDQLQHEWPQWAGEVINRLATYCARCPAGVPVQMFLASGDAGSEVVRFAGEHREDAIALVRRSRLEHGHARILRAILAQTPCPVLLVGGPSGY